MLGETSNWQTWTSHVLCHSRKSEHCGVICDSQIFFLFNKKSRLIYNRHFMEAWWQGLIVIAATPLEAKFRASLSNFKRLFLKIKHVNGLDVAHWWSPCLIYMRNTQVQTLYPRREQEWGRSSLPPLEDSLVLYCLYCSSPPSCGQRGQVRSLCLPFLWVCYCSSHVAGRRQEGRLCVKLPFNV